MDVERQRGAVARCHGCEACEAVLRARELADLAHLYDSRIMLALAPARPDAEALRHAATLVDAGERRARVEVDTPGGAPAPGVLDRLAIHDGPDAQAWTSYVEKITEIFACLLDAKTVGVRLVVSDGPHCPRFHVDQVVARGVLTVIGAGTEWLDDAHLDRSRLGHAGGPGGDDVSGLVRDWGQVRRAVPGELAVFKGAAWPGAAGRSVVHRSPPADGVRRVVLTLDWLD